MGVCRTEHAKKNCEWKKMNEENMKGNERGEVLDAIHAIFTRPYTLFDNSLHNATLRPATRLSLVCDRIVCHVGKLKHNANL